MVEKGIESWRKGEFEMDLQRLRDKKQDFKRALDRLQEALGLPVDHTIIIDGVIQRFEFTYELAWKSMKAYLEYKGIYEAKTPRDVIRQSYVIGLITDGDSFIAMLKDRNLTSHTYDEETARVIYHQIKNTYYPLLKSVYDSLDIEDE